MRRLEMDQAAYEKQNCREIESTIAVIQKLKIDVQYPISCSFWDAVYGVYAEAKNMVGVDSINRSSEDVR